MPHLVWQIVLSIYTFEFRFIPTPALFTPSPGQIAPLLDNTFSSRIAPTVPDSILRKILL